MEYENDATTDGELEPPDAEKPKQPENTPKGSRNLHLLMHAPHTDVTLCKSITSSLALDYPTPRLINWGQELEAHNDNLAKFSALVKYLDGLPGGRDEDLVLIVDGYNTWFQLRPEVLIRRFLEVNDRATKRIQTESKSEDRKDLAQKIVFTAQRECWPWSTDDPTCRMVPQSTLPDDMYGPDTDKYDGSERYPYKSFRPRFLNSGAYIGRLGAMKALMTRAKKIATADRLANDQLGDMWASQDWSKRNDQVIFQRIFKEQEIAREHGNCTQWGSSRVKCEFNIGLDYESRLAHAHALTEGDLEWMRHDWLGDNHTAPAVEPKNKLESRDLVQAQKPFKNLEYDDQPGWEDMMLFSDRFTNVVPAIVQHDMDTENLLRIGDKPWSKMWYHEHVWAMLEARPNGESEKKLATTTINGEEVQWWTPPQPDKKSQGAYADDDKFIAWSELCGPWEDDVFRGNNNP